VQVLELGVPVILVLNMSDRAAERGITIDTERLGRELGAPVVTAVASQGQGLAELRALIAAEAKTHAVA